MSQIALPAWVQSFTLIDEPPAIRALETSLADRMDIGYSLSVAIKAVSESAREPGITESERQRRLAHAIRLCDLRKRIRTL